MASQPQSKKIYWFLILVFFLFSMAIGTVGYFFYENQKKSLRQEKWEQLNAITDLKVRQIVNWRKERMEDASIILESPFISLHVQRFLKDPKAFQVSQEMIEWLKSLQRRYHYQSVFLLDARGTVKLSVVEGKEVLGAYAKTLALEAMRKKEVIFSDIYRGEAVGEIHIDLLVPLFDPKDKETLSVGAILLRIYPNQFLYPLIQSWPTPSRTSESLLVRREGEEIVFLNELRHRKDTALKLSFPIGEQQFPAIMAAKGKEGIVEGSDYRGVQVLAAIRHIPDSPWFLVAKVDQEEIYALIRVRTMFIAALVGVLIIGSALSVVLLWRGQRFLFQKEQYKTELERRALTEHFDYLTRYANDIILFMDKDLRILEANERAVESYGYSREELLQLSLKDLRVPETRPVLEADMKKVKEHNGYILENLHQRKDGTKFPVENSSRVIEVDGKIFYQSIVRDITERKQTEETLRGEREKLEMVTQNMGAGLAFISKDYHTLWANNVLKQIFGNVEGKPCYSTYNQKAEVCPGCGVQEVFEKGSEKVVHEQVGKDIQGNTIWSEIIATPIKDKDGNIMAALELVIPITERKQAEKEMIALQEQFRQSQKMEAIGRLAGGIAHDFNNLLTVIKGYSQLSLVEIKEGDPLRGNIEEIKNAADRAADLTRQLLAFSRRQIMEMKVLELNDLLKNLDKMLRRVIGEDIELVMVLADDLGRVKTDPGQIEQVVMNLAVNARDAMLHGGKLTIETANVDLDDAYARNHIAVTPGRFVMISVSDTGVGMTPEVRDRVFDPFFTTKERGKGTGLGLSTVYGIVKQSDGNIWVYSEPGKGTTFKIYLPRVDEPLEELGERVEVKEIPRGTETILIVEDEEEVLKLAGRILSRQGYTVLQTSSTSKALEICKEQKKSIHLILTDVIMPQMSGRELIERCREIRQDFKALYMSGYTDNAITHHGVLEKGMNYIQKPFTVDGLARRVREVLDH